MKKLLLLLVFITSAFQSIGQVVIRDTFTDYTSAKRYGVTGYALFSGTEFSALPNLQTGYYVTTMQLHNDWKYLTNSFALEAFKRSELTLRQDSINIVLVSLIAAKDTTIMAWQHKFYEQARTAFEKERIYKEESAQVQKAFEDSTKRTAELSLLLDKEKTKVRNWRNIAIGGVFLGFLVGALVL